MLPIKFIQVVLFTLSLPYQRSKFFYDSRVVFESLFIRSFQDGIVEPRDAYAAYNIQTIFSQFEHISSQVYYIFMYMYVCIYKYYTSLYAVFYCDRKSSAIAALYYMILKFEWSNPIFVYGLYN